MIIKRKLYTDRRYYLDQREFGLISNLWKKGKKKIRLGISTKLAKIERKNRNKNSEVSKVMRDLENKQRVNPELSKRIQDEAERSGIGIYGDNKPIKILTLITDKNSKNVLIRKDVKLVKKEFDMYKKELGYEPEGIDREILDSFYKNNGNIINIRGELSKNNQIAAHELGHWKNAKSKKGSLKRGIYELDKLVREKPDKKFIPNENKGKTRNRIAKTGTILENLGKDLGEMIIVPQEERNAWNNGIKVLKKSGASKDELQLMRDLKKKFVESYVTGLKAIKAEKYKNKIRPVKIKNKKDDNISKRKQ